MEREWSVEESTVVAVPPEGAYAAIAEVRRTGEWSPECRAVWARRGPLPAGARFVGFNRKGPLVWFTTSRVTVAEPGREFAFRVTAFGMPIALWGYRFAPADGGGTLVTEYWQDLRTGRTRRPAELLGLVFSATPAAGRAGANRAGMRTTLARFKHTLES